MIKGTQVGEEGTWCFLLFSFFLLLFYSSTNDATL